MKGKHDISPCTAAVSIPSQMSMSAQEPGLKRIGDMLQLKRKIGRPLKKKTLIKMAKLMTMVQKEDAIYNNKQDGWVEEKVTTVQQEVTSHKHKKVIKETKKTESDFPHLRRSSRTTKPVEITDPTEHILPPSGHIEPFLRKEDSTCTLSTASPSRMCSAEAAPQIDFPSLHKGKIKGGQRSPKKISEIKKKKNTYEGSDPPNIPTKTLPEVEPTDNGVEKTTKAKRRKMDSEANKKNKQGISALEPMFSTVPQEGIYADHDNGISTQTVITPLNSLHQKPLKRTKYKKGKKERDIPLLNTTEQFGVCCSLPESPVLHSPVECDAENPRKAKKQCNIKSPLQSDFHPSEKKTNVKCVMSTKAKKSRKRKVPSKTNRVDSSTADIILGEMPVCSSQSVRGSKLKNKNSCHSKKPQTEAVSSLTRDSLPIKVEPQTRKGSRNKLNNADLTSNPETENPPEKKSQQKSRMKKIELNLSTALPHPNAANENVLLPVLNPTIAEKTKHKMPSLPTSTVSRPVPASLATPSEKGQVAEPVSARGLKRKQPQKVMRSKKREVRTSKPKLHNGCNVSNDEDLVKCTEMDGMLNEMENYPKKKRVMKASMGKTDDLNMQSTCPESLVQSTVTEHKLAPVAVNVKHKKSRLSPSSATPLLPSSAASTDEGQLAESAGGKRHPQQRGKLSKRKSRPPRKKRKVNNRNNLSKEIKHLASVKVPSDKVLTAKVVKDALAVASTAEHENNMLAGLNHYTSPSGRNTKDISILSDSTIESVAELDNTLWKSTDSPNRNQSSSQSETITSNNMDVLCDIKIQKVRQKTCGAQGETGVSEKVHENKEAVNRLSTANSTLLHSNVKLRKLITCRFCGCTYRHISAYSVHECIHTGKMPYRCLKCGKRFARFSKLRLHANIHRRPDPIRCPCCSLGFPNKAELIVHFKIHMKRTEKVSLMGNKKRGRDIQAQMPANDTLPPVPLKTSASLIRHSSFNDTLEIHTSPSNGLVKPYICSICGMKFDKSSSYYIHGRTHRHAQPYACSVCGEGFNQLRKLKAHSRTHSGEMPSSAARCDDTSCGLSSPHSHPTSKACYETTDEADRSAVDFDGFLVKQGVDGPINTPMFFKCQICKQLHRHWCQYVLHLQTHTKVYSYLCKVCRQQYNQVSKTTIHCKVCCKKSGEERACNASLSEVLQEPPSSPSRTLGHPEILPGDHQEPWSQASSSEMSCGSEHQKKQPAGKLSGLLANASRRRYACAQCGKSFNQWNKLWLHHKMHRQKGRCFPCTQCKLEFYYFGSYRDHMQEHAALSPFVCPLCPKAFIASEDLSTHLCEHHNPCEYLKCHTCGKCFTSFQSLERHGRLHKGANSNHCLLCDVSFRSTSALQDHLKTHESLLRNPLPAGPVEPFLYPYHCRKCKARFTSTDLLQAHQVCHLNASGKPVSSSPQTVVSSHQSKTPRKGILKALPVFSKQKKTCRVTKRNNLFRYPHPDQLYVVPVLSSEPPVVISDAEDPQVIVTTPLTPSSPINNPSDIVHTRNGHANGITEVTPSQSAQPTTKSTTVLLNDVNAKLCRQATTPLKHTSCGALGRDLVRNVPSRGQAVSRDEDADDEYEDDDLVEVSAAAATSGEPEGDEFSCVVCQATFTVVSDLHDHYVHHARGVI
ncbi:uncharacterized protein si:ch73-347e22.4 [Osmerus eperlanus]|uniref:uncharacterized protein si:ch73-347e22.4 n=1 Tax=Osmerus eperlanus TaxID=29151 RepID=UPI002E0DA748